MSLLLRCSKSLFPLRRAAFGALTLLLVLSLGCDDHVYEREAAQLDFPDLSYGDLDWVQPPPDVV
ncbi:MAG: hypothetical protein RBU37_12225, partial [Myxococcota bacterium]|nr:hypothetical protein [Myxococcota bacterium]